MTVKINGTSGLIFEDGILQSYGDDNDLQINHDGSNSYINDAGTGNLRLQTGGSTKLEVTSSGIDVTGTVTADGLTVDGDATVAGTIGVTADNGTITTGKDSLSNRTHWKMNNTNGEVAKWDSNGSDLLHYITDEYKLYTAGNKALEIDGNGDISFYEDTGTTTKFFWDASAESLGIGTTSPSAQLHLSSPNNIGGSSGTFSNAAIRIGTTSSSSMYLDSNEIHSSETINLFSNGTDNGVADYIRFWTGGSAGAERMRINSSGNVGIGTTTPTAKLDVVETVASTTSAIWTGETLALKDDTAYAQGVGGALIFEGKYNSSGSYSTFGYIRGSKTDATDGGFQGGIVYGTRSGDHIFVTSASGRTDGTDERMRIDSSGNLMVGTTSTSVAGASGGSNEGIRLDGAQGQLQVAAISDTTMYLNRQSTDGTIAEFRKDGSAVGYISANNGALAIGTPAGTSSTGIRLGSEAVVPTYSDGSDKDNRNNLGSSSVRWKDLYLSGGVYVGGTGSANHLDDYEEGTWTPTMNGAGSFSALDTCRYIKIGRLVQITFSGSTTGTTTSSYISGLPFASVDNGANYTYGAMDLRTANTRFVLASNVNFIYAFGISTAALQSFSSSIGCTLTYYTNS